jgi:serine/threonine protein kinase
VSLGLQYGTQSDLWSCGVVLFILLFGDAPFSDQREGD